MHSSSFKILVTVIFTVKFLLASCFYLQIVAEIFYCLFVSRIFVTTCGMTCYDGCFKTLVSSHVGAILLLPVAGYFDSLKLGISLILGKMSDLFFVVVLLNFYIWSIICRL